MNFAAAGLVMISLIVSFNLASLLIQTFWIAVSVFGIALNTLRPPNRTTIAITKRHGKAAAPGRNGAMASVPVIEMFLSESDRICIEVDGTQHHREHREIVLTSHANGKGVDIWLDGGLVAHVENAGALRPTHVSLVLRPPGQSEGKVHWLSA